MRINAERSPDRTAVLVDDRVITFQALYERTRSLTTALAAVTGKGDRVAILAENLPEYVEAYYGVPSAGLALTFLNYRLHADEWAWILNHAQARVLLVDASYLRAAEHLQAAVPSLETVVVIGGDAADHGFIDYEQFLSGAPAGITDPVLSEDDLAWLIYTSGTTGFPKGAMLTHRNLMTSVLQSVMALRPRPDDRELVAMPLCHVAGYAVPCQHLGGGAVVLMRTYEPEAFLQLVERHKISVTGLAPAMINFLLNHPRATDYDLSSIRMVKYGAAPMPLEVLRITLARFGPAVQTLFGMTELAGGVTFLDEVDHVRAVSGDAHLLASCGRPAPLCSVRIVDDTSTECPAGVVGEIIVRGEQVMRGYWSNPEGTAEALAGGWFHTGDMAYRDAEGFFYIVDRKKDMIVTGGENVYSKEVEDVLFDHEAVLEAAVIGVPDPTWGERVTAVVVLHPGVEATEADIIATCKARLAGFKAPKAVYFTESLPKNATGKVLKRELRETYGRIPA